MLKICCLTLNNLHLTGIPLQRLVNLDQLDVIFFKINNIIWHLRSKQYIKTLSLNSEDFALKVLF